MYNLSFAASKKMVSNFTNDSLLKNHTTRHCPLWPTKPERCNVVLHLQFAFSSLSFLGCFLIISFILLRRKYNIAIHRLVFWLSTSALIKAMAMLISKIYEVNDNFCRFQGFVKLYFSWATLLWVLVITLNCLFIVQGKPHERYHFGYHVSVWTGSFAWSIFPFIWDAYGPAGIWCWIKRDSTGLRFGIWYIPLLTICLIMLAIHSYIILHVLRHKWQLNQDKREEEHLSDTRLREELKPLLAYPLIYLLFSIPIFMYRIDDATKPHKPPHYGLLILSAIFTPARGMCFALAFAIHQNPVNRLSFIKMRQWFRDLINRSPTHVIHYNYKVDDNLEANS